MLDRACPHWLRKKPGERLGLNWSSPAPGPRAIRHVTFDTNFWKSFVHARLSVAIGDPGCLTLFGRNGEDHRLLAEHLTAEYKVRTQGRGREVDEWRLRADGLDNHWLDCLVGAAVGASIEGVVLTSGHAPKRKRQKVSMSRLQWEARQRS